jgi:membrane protein
MSEGDGMSDAAESPGSRTDPNAASHAFAPGQIPASAWWLILRRVGRHFLASRLPLLGAGVAFFAVLSIAPVLVTAMSVYGAANTPEQALNQLSHVAEVLPSEMEPIVAEQLTTITAASTQVLTRRGVFGLALALWTATTAMMCLIEALTAAYHESETRGFVRRSLLALAFVLGGALLLGAVLAVAGVASRALTGAPRELRTVVPILTWMGLAVLMAAVLAVLYRFAPDRKQARWRWVTWGSTAATALWLVTSVALFAYVKSLGTYESTYGSLAGVAISMFWLWISIVIVLLGAALNAEAERQTQHDTTVGSARPLGQRGAVVADSVPPYPSDG